MLTWRRLLMAAGRRLQESGRREESWKMKEDGMESVAVAVGLAVEGAAEVGPCWKGAMISVEKEEGKVRDRRW
jgi:hypothetical protein